MTRPKTRLAFDIKIKKPEIEHSCPYNEESVLNEKSTSPELVRNKIVNEYFYIFLFLQEEYTE